MEWAKSNYLDQTAVHAFGPLQVVESLKKRIVAEDGPGEAERVGCRARHVLHQAVLDFLQNQIERLALGWVGVKLVVADRDRPAPPRRHVQKRRSTVS